VQFSFAKMFRPRGTIRKCCCVRPEWTKINLHCVKLRVWEILFVCAMEMRRHGTHVCRTHYYAYPYTYRVPIRTCVHDNNITDATRSLRRRQRVLAHTHTAVFLRPRKKTRARVSYIRKYCRYVLSSFTAPEKKNKQVFPRPRVGI